MTQKSVSHENTPSFGKPQVDIEVLRGMDSRFNWILVIGIAEGTLWCLSHQCEV